MLQCLLHVRNWYHFVCLSQPREQASARREKASSDAGSVGAPMPGVVVDVKVKVGDSVAEGDQLITMSAMKMETAIPAPRSGVIQRITVNAGDKVRRLLGHSCLATCANFRSSLPSKMPIHTLATGGR